MCAYPLNVFKVKQDSSRIRALSFSNANKHIERKKGNKITKLKINDEPSRRKRLMSLRMKTGMHSFKSDRTNGDVHLLVDHQISIGTVKFRAILEKCPGECSSNEKCTGKSKHSTFNNKMVEGKTLFLFIQQSKISFNQNNCQANVVYGSGFISSNENNSNEMILYYGI